RRIALAGAILAGVLFLATGDPADGRSARGRPRRRRGRCHSFCRGRRRSGFGGRWRGRGGCRRALPRRRGRLVPVATGGARKGRGEGGGADDAPLKLMHVGSRLWIQTSLRTSIARTAASNAARAHPSLAGNR